jgi:hypothetical protein
MDSQTKIIASPHIIKSTSTTSSIIIINNQVEKKLPYAQALHWYWLLHQQLFNKQPTIKVTPSGRHQQTKSTTKINNNINNNIITSKQLYSTKSTIAQEQK